MTRRPPSEQPPLLAEERAAHRDQSPEEADAWRERLAQALADPALRATPGFPIAEDEAILALSDPPYYTACPNPFLPEIIDAWQTERRATRAALGLPDDTPNTQSPIPNTQSYHRDPFAADVSEGKNDPIYNAHSYHTKVPHKAIMRYILHYTDPGDIVLDGFCGTGMTGVAAQLCGDRKTVQSLGYHVDDEGVIYESANRQTPISRLGPRKAVLTDLSPAATFIAYNYNTPVDAATFEREAKRILKEVEKECGWMYETWHRPSPPAPSPTLGEGNRTTESPPSPAQAEKGNASTTASTTPGAGEGGRGVRGKINYTVWSDVFVCPQCNGEMIFWDVAVDAEAGKVRDDWPCPHCTAQLSKSPRKASPAQKVERAIETRYDRALGRSIRQAKQVPVLINYSVGKQRHEKRPDAADLALIQRLEESDIPYWFPTDALPDGDKTPDPINLGITHVHHFYTPRSLSLFSALWSRAQTKIMRSTLLGGYTVGLRTARFLPLRWVQKDTGPMKPHTPGTLYVPSLNGEQNWLNITRSRISSVSRYLPRMANDAEALVTIITGSAAKFDSLPDSIDYIFVDPPFGANLMYSELNFLNESWLAVLTNRLFEAVVSKKQRKGLPQYQELMERSFSEFYRMLKPGRWMTVEFHNSQNAVWNAIQEALLRAGFMVADVRTFDKQQGTFNQVTTTGSVKQDLIISAYKPDRALEERFLTSGGTASAAWEFVARHLDQLPVPVLKDGSLETLAERQPFLLYDRMVAFHVQRGLAVPLSAAEFYQGLSARFLERDGMIFNPLHAAEYDKRRMQAERVEQLALFLNDERSAIQWLQRELDPATGNGPQSYQDVQPRFLRELHQARHEAMPELREILEENFLQDEAGRWYVPDPDRQEDLEKLRQKSLLREFAQYLQGRGRLRTFRGEAVRAGFSHAWRQRDYATILKVADRLPSNVLEEDANLLMYVDNARLRHQDVPAQPSLLE